MQGLPGGCNPGAPGVDGGDPASGWLLGSKEKFPKIFVLDKITLVPSDKEWSFQPDPDSVAVRNIHTMVARVEVSGSDVHFCPAR